MFIRDLWFLTLVDCFNVKCFAFQITDVQVQVTQNTEALQGARTEVNDLRRQVQTLEIELDSQKNLVSCES